jgi:hypothetical protein
VTSKARLSAMAVSTETESRLGGGESPRRPLVVAALTTFWATLLLALGVPGSGPIFFGALAGSALVALRRVRVGAAVPVPALPRGVPGRLRRAARGTLALLRGVLRSVAGVLRRTAGLVRETAARAGRRARRVPLVLAPPGTRDRSGEAWRFCRTGAALRQQGRADEAVECCETAVWLFRDLDDTRGLALALNGLGLALVRQGRPEDALPRYQEATELLGALGERHGQGQVLANLGAALRSQGKRDEALASWQDALERLDPGSAEYARTGRELRAAS